MTETSMRFALPFLLPGQAQKEVFHNEALAMIDGALHPCAAGIADSPPDTPEQGESWIVGGDASGAWANREGNVAVWTGGGWRFLAPVAGMSVWDMSSGLWRYWTTTGWSDGALPAAAIRIDGVQVIGPRLPDVSNPSGGTTIDAEARGAIGALIATLKSHGLID